MSIIPNENIYFRNYNVKTVYLGNPIFEKFLNKVNWSEVKKTLIKLNDISKENNGILNKSLLEDEYMFDEYNPVIINDVINKEALIIIQNFIKEAINRKEIDLGDRQSNRFRARNETITRFLHYEVLELIRKITGTVLG